MSLLPPPADTSSLWSNGWWIHIFFRVLLSVFCSVFFSFCFLGIQGCGALEAKVGDSGGIERSELEAADKGENVQSEVNGME